MKIKAGLYLRISDDRLGDSLGVKRQEKLCRELAESRGWQVVTTYTDNDLSAYRGRRRPGYEQLLSDLTEGRLGAVVAYHPDRLYRHPRDLERFVETVESSKAAVATVTAGELDLSTASGRMVARMLGAASRYESEHKAERHRAKHAELAAAGKVAGGGDRPFGFEEDRVKIRKPEAVLIKEGVRRVLAGEAIRSVVRDWNQRELMTTRGGEWLPVTLRRMLVSGRIAGLRTHLGKVAAVAEWPGIISREEHEELRAILTNGNRTKGSPRKYLLTGGLARCGECGAGLVARPKGGGRRQYVCSRGPGHHGCGAIAILADPLETFVAHSVLVALDSPEFTRTLRRALETDQAQDDFGTELTTIEQRLKNLQKAHYVEGTLSKTDFRRLSKELTDRMADLHATIAARTTSRALSAVPVEGKHLWSWWEAATFEQRRALLVAVLDRVIVRRAVKGRNRFDPERVELVWQG